MGKRRERGGKTKKEERREKVRVTDRGKRGRE